MLLKKQFHLTEKQIKYINTQSCLRCISASELMREVLNTFMKEERLKDNEVLKNKRRH